MRGMRAELKVRLKVHTSRLNEALPATHTPFPKYQCLMQNRRRSHFVTLIFAFAIAIFSTTTSLTHAQEIIEDYEDKSTGGHVIASSKHQIEHGGFIGVALTQYVHMSSRSDTPYVFMLITMSEDGSQATEDDIAEFIIDDKRTTHSLTFAGTDTASEGSG